MNVVKKKLILVGGGGHCKSCIDVIEAEGTYKIEGILDTPENAGGNVLGYPVVGDDSHIPFFIEQGFSFIVSVGQIKTPELRENLFNLLVKQNASIATIVSPKALVSPHAQIGIGTMVFHGAQVNAGARIGRNCIINSGSLVEHDAAVGDHVHISTHAVVNGEAMIQNGCYIGSNSVVNLRVKVCSGTVVGSGSVVVRDVKEAGVYAGNPLKRLDK